MVLFLMEKQFLAMEFESHSNYIKLPESVLTEFNQPKNSNSLGNYYHNKNKKPTGINLREQLKSSSEVKIQPPYYFSIESGFGKFAYVGVLDFTAEEGMVMLPHAIMEYLDIIGSDFVTIKYIGNIPKGDFVQLEPLQREIFDIEELDKYLEKAISNYCLLYPEQIITCGSENQDIQYSIKVKSIKSICEFDTEPELIDIVNTDLKIDIYNRFLEEELIEKEKKLKEQAELKRKVQLAQQLQQGQQAQQDQNKEYFTGTGIKLGGDIKTTDPALMRELRLQKLLAIQAQAELEKPKLINSIKPTVPIKQSFQENPIAVPAQSNLSTQQSDGKIKPKSSKKPKDIEV